MFENTRWMLSKCYHDDKSLYFRKEFEVYGDVKEAKLYIIMLGMGECRINGENVADDVLTTPYTRFDKRLLYREYDVSRLVKKGKNAIGLHIGNGFYNCDMKEWHECYSTWREKPRALVNLFIKTTDGCEILIKGDNTWKSDFGCCPYNGVRRGEICDGRLKVAYDRVGFDDSAWQNVEAVAEPGGVYLPFDMEPIKVVRELKPVSLDNGIYDFGENISGWCKIKLSGEAGQTVSLKYGEKITDDGEISDTCALFARNEGYELLQEDRYICAGKNDEEYAPTFGYHGFRYVKVTNAPKDFDITAQVIHTDLKKIGDFNCSDDMLNKIHKASVRSTLTNYHGIPEDCPHREQNGWLGDAHLSSDQALMNFDMTRAYKKYINDIADTQRPNGQVSQIAPTSNWGYSSVAVSWSVAYMLIPWNMYNTYGDKQALIENFDGYVKLAELCERMSEDYIIDLGYPDWCAPQHIKKCSASVINTAYLHMMFKLIADIGRVIGKSEILCKEYDNKAELVKKAWRKKFWVGSAQDEWKDNQTFYAVAVYHNLTDTEEERKQAVSKLVQLIKDRDYHLEMGIFGIKSVFTVLSEYGYADVLYKAVTNESFPSYAYWINNGMTTLCESWEMTDSLNHHMYSEVDNWFYRHLGGISISNGGRDLTVAPVLIEDVKEVNASFKDVFVKIKDGKMTVDIPKGYDKVIVEWKGKAFNPTYGHYTFD